MAELSRLPGTNTDHWNWQMDAACRGEESAKFFHPEGERGAARVVRQNRAKQICASCPVRQACLDHALAVREPYGIWGGLGEGRVGSAVSEAQTPDRRLNHHPVAPQPLPLARPGRPRAFAPGAFSCPSTDQT
ncbi:MAG: WhiB family transcriptional regulator [Micrococcales bacterium]|nr:WhiB family transcriptional regulator [Micrococcales bacterium]